MRLLFIHVAQNGILIVMIIVTGTSDVGSGDFNLYVTNSRIEDEDGFDFDDSDYDVFIEEVCSTLKNKMFNTPFYDYKTYEYRFSQICF